MQHKDVYRRALDGNLIDKIEPLIDFLRYIQEEADLNNQARRSPVSLNLRLKEYVIFLEGLFEIKEGVTDTSDKKVIFKGDEVRLNDCSLDVKKKLLARIRSGAEVESQQDSEAGENKVTVSLSSMQWLEILENLSNRSEIIELLSLNLEVLEHINRLYIEAGSIFDKTYGENGPIRFEKRAAEVLNKLGFTKQSKKQPKIDRDWLYFDYMLKVAIAEKRAELTDEKKWQFIKELAQKNESTENTVYQYIKEEITARRKPEPDYFAPHPKKTYLPREKI